MLSASMQRAGQCRKDDCGQENSWSGYFDSQPHAWLSDPFSAVQGVGMHSPHLYKNARALSLIVDAWTCIFSGFALYVGCG